VRLSREDYEPLKGFFGWMCDHILMRSVSLPEEAHPIRVLAEMERRSPARAREGLGTAIGDIIEMTQNFGSAPVAEIDEALRAQGLPTLSQVRAKFSSAIARILRRGSIRSETEYYSVRNVVEALPEAEQAAVWRLLADFEERLPRPKQQA
jgi:hypothetical protein